METTGKPLVLIAEDDSSNFKYLEVLLRRDYDILWAKNGREAVTMALENNPVFVLMDVKMPLMTGIEAVTEIKQSKPQLPIIMQTAFAFDSDKELAMNAGADAYLTKPILVNKLKETIAKFV